MKPERAANWKALLLVAGACLTGCGSECDADHTSLSGTVTFRGQPVPYGVIYFHPDASQGNHGSQGFAEIIDGEYSTRSGGMSAVFGPVVVQIKGFNHKQTPEAETPATSLFRTYQTKVIIEEGMETLDFDVP